MHPILFRIPLPGWDLPLLGKVTSLPIYSYGVMLGLSIVVGWYLTLGLASRDFARVYPDEAKQAEFRETMANCYVFTAVMAVIGSRVLYVATNLDEFKTFNDLFALRRGGLVAYGGFLGGFLGSWLYLKQRGFRLLPWADWAVPSLATGLWLTRIGCYLFGCDFGKQLPAGAPGFLKTLGTFPHWAEGTIDKGTGSPAWFQHYERHLVGLDSAHSLPVHPTQIYESLVGLSIFGMLMFQRRHQRFRGQVFLLFTFVYGFLRYLLEIIRDDAERGEYGPMLSEHVLVPGGLLFFGLAYILFVARAIPQPALRVVTQAVALVPAAAMFVALRPANFVEANLVRLSTSQWVALLTGVAAAVAYGAFWNMAKAHPEQAMALGGVGSLGAAAVDEAGEGDRAETADEGEPRPKKRRKSKARAAAEAEAEAGNEGEGAEEASGEEKEDDEGAAPKRPAASHDEEEKGDTDEAGGKNLEPA
jgi:phosphatidylglycerol---prolipoprotein diacylglyceryl transferase